LVSCAVFQAQDRQFVTGARVSIPTRRYDLDMYSTSDTMPAHSAPVVAELKCVLTVLHRILPAAHAACWSTEVHQIAIASVIRAINIATTQIAAEPKTALPITTTLPILEMATEVIVGIRSPHVDQLLRDANEALADVIGRLGSHSNKRA
jgi:hypothetical protein